MLVILAKKTDNKMEIAEKDDEIELDYLRKIMYKITTLLLIC